MHGPRRCIQRSQLYDQSTPSRVPSRRTSKIQSGGNFYQGQGWRSHPKNNFNRNQRVSSNRSPNQGPDLYEKTTELEDTLNQFMQVSLSNHKSIKSAIINLEVQVDQLAKQLVETSTDNFGANMEKNPKEECKVIFTRSQRRENVEREKRDERVLEDVSNEEGEDNKREEGDEEKEESKEKGEKVLPTKTKSQLAREARKEIPSVRVKDIPYPLVPPKKDKEQYFARFLDIFNKLEIIIPFREAL